MFVHRPRNGAKPDHRSQRRPGGGFARGHPRSCEDGFDPPIPSHRRGGAGWRWCARHGPPGRPAVHGRNGHPGGPGGWHQHGRPGLGPLLARLRSAVPGFAGTRHRLDRDDVRQDSGQLPDLQGPSQQGTLRPDDSVPLRRRGHAVPNRPADPLQQEL